MARVIHAKGGRKQATQPGTQASLGIPTLPKPGQAKEQLKPLKWIRFEDADAKSRARQLAQVCVCVINGVNGTELHLLGLLI